MMKKYKVDLMGSMSFFAKNKDHALKMAEEDIKVTHPKFNIEISTLSPYRNTQKYFNLRITNQIYPILIANSNFVKKMIFNT